MKKTMTAGGLALLIVSAMMIAGCGGEEAEMATCSICMEEIPADQVQMVGGEVMCKKCAEMDDGTEVAEETHDCDGPCPMTDVPLSKLTVVDGKYYCKGCLTKLKAEGVIDDAVDAVEGAAEEAGELLEKVDEHAGHDHG